jgi:predicted P-loop ATPase
MEKKQENVEDTNAENTQAENQPANPTEPTQANGSKKPAKEKTERAPLVKWVEDVIRRNFTLRRNVVNNQLQNLNHNGQYVPITEDDIYRVVLHAGLGDFKLPEFKSILRSNFVKDDHPFLARFSSLPKWDSKTDPDYIKKLASYVECEDPAFFETQLKKYMVRAIRCALQSGWPNRTVLVFYGGQDIGKSWFIRFLNPFGREYYSESPLRDDNKDSWIKVSENFLINLEELASLTLTATDKLKQFISIAWVKERRPYGIEEQAMQRRCSFIGSTNKPEFLIDSQNTRWIIIKVKDINKAYSKEFNIDNAWAQAYALYQDKNFDCELTLSEQRQRDNINAEFEVVSPEHDAVVRFLKPCKPDDEGAEFKTKAEILDILHERTMMTIYGESMRSVMNPIKMNPYAVINALHKEKFIGGRQYINGKQHRGYWLIEVPLPKVTDKQTHLAFDENEFTQPQKVAVPLVDTPKQDKEDKKEVDNNSPITDVYDGL